jgi:glycosyltransferase involved in cell wall biosynthesis
LIAVYNSAPYLPAAIESVLAQTLTDFECLLIDDGSTDQSWSILQRYAAQDARLRIFRQENQGIARTRNRLLAEAQAELVAIMDADDIMLPDRLKQQVQFLHTHPAVVCVGGALDWIDHRGRVLGHCPMPLENCEIQRLLLGGISLLHHPCAMARRSAILQAGGYDPSLIASVDLDLWLRLGELGELANLPESVLQYRLHASSITHANQQRQAQDALTACQRAWQRRGITAEFIRQSADHLKQHRFWLDRGWQNFLAGKRSIAQYCGVQAIKTQPRDWEAWKLWLCAWIKPIPVFPPADRTDGTETAQSD